MVKHTHKHKHARTSMSVFRLLLVAAFAGAMCGVILALWQQPPDEAFLERAERAVSTAMPLGNAVTQRSVAAHSPALRGIPTYPGATAKPQPIVHSKPDSGVVNAISWFVTPDSVDKVLSFYEDTYSSANILYVSKRFSERRGYVSWLERRLGRQAEFGEGVLRMVIASREGKSTTVLHSANEPSRLLQQGTPMPVDVNLPEGARPYVMNLSGENADYYTVFAEYTGKSKKELLAEFLSNMHSGRWTVHKPRRSADGNITVAAFSATHVQVAVVGKTFKGAQVLLTLEQRQKGHIP